MEQVNYTNSIRHPIFRTIANAAEHLNSEAYVIGGFVRDILLERQCQDVDIVTSGDGILLAKECAGSLGVKKVTVF